MNCPKCKSTKLRTYDNESLYHPKKDDCELQGYNGIGFDCEIYVSVLCDECGHMGHACGQIKWNEADIS